MRRPASPEALAVVVALVAVPVVAVQSALLLCCGVVAVTGMRSVAGGPGRRWVEDGGPRGALDRALASSYRPVDTRWARSTVRISTVDALLLDAWLIVGGLLRAALGALLLAIV